MKQKDILLITGSAVSLTEARLILAALPIGFNLPVIYQMPCSSAVFDIMAGILKSKTHLAVCAAGNGASLQPGTVYLCPPECCIAITPQGNIQLKLSPSATAAANTTLQNIAAFYGERAIIVALNEKQQEVHAGLHAAVMKRASVIVRQKETLFSHIKEMPKAGLDYNIMPLEEIVPSIAALCKMEPQTTPHHAKAILVSEKLKFYLDYYLGLANKPYGAGGGDIKLIKPKTELFVTVIERGMALGPVTQQYNVFDNTPYGQAVRSKQAVAIPDIQVERRFKSFGQPNVYRAVKVIPFYNLAGKPLGTLSTYLPFPHVFSEKEIGKTMEIAQLVANAVEQFPVSA